MEKSTVNLFEKFIELEDKYNFFEIKINNIKIWQYIRFSCCAKILEELTGVRTTNKENRKKIICQSKKDINEYFKRNEFLLRKKTLLIINHPRRVKDGKIYKCFVTDAFLKSIKSSYYVFEDSYEGKHYQPVPTKNIKYRNINNLQNWISYNDKNDREKIKTVVKKIIKCFEKELLIQFGVKLNKYIFELIDNTLRMIFYGRLYAKIILRLIRPKAVLIAVHYNVYNQALIEVAKEMKIPTIELQHGRIGESHAAYNFINIRNIETFPDYVFVYGNYEKEIPRYPITKEQIFAIGYPELEQKAEYYKKIKKENKRKVVTFISSPTDGNIISKYAIEFAKRTKEKDFKIIYKLHPSEYNTWKEQYLNLTEYKISIVNSNLHDIYYYLGHSDYVIGISSTVLFEAMMFNVNIIILREQDYIKCKAIYENNCATLVSSAEELINVIGKNNMNTFSHNVDFYFERNSIKKMKDAINTILDKTIIK